jgi:hypothetical protein
LQPQLQQHLNGQQLHVFFIFITNELPTTPLITQKMATAIQRLNKILIETTA